jgi:hypothetical protein
LISQSHGYFLVCVSGTYQEGIPPPPLRFRAQVFRRRVQTLARPRVVATTTVLT